MFSKGLPSSEPIKETLNRVSEFDILKHYLGITTIPCIINSPLRRDRKPSLGLYSYNGNRIHYTDFGTGESGSVIDLMGSIWGMTLTECLNKINKDLPSFSTLHTPIKITFRGVKSNTNPGSITLKVKIRPWRKYDTDYWESYGISLPWLKFGQIYPISFIIIDKSGVKSVVPAEKYAYAYLECKDNITTFKIYQPFSKDYKWMNKHDSSVWDLWTQLPKTGENLIITSSRKDALCIWENTGIPTCSLQGEGYIPKDKVIKQLKNRFKNIYILYDNDFTSDQNHGEIFGKHIAEEFNLMQLTLPIEYLSKDTSDLCKNHGRKVVREVILNLIKEKQKKSLIN